MSEADRQRRRCARCRAWLAGDNPGEQCSPCLAAQRHTDDEIGPFAAPELPSSFWQDEALRSALATRHMGKVIRAYRRHPHHGRRGLPQDEVAGWAEISQGQLSRIESGKPIGRLDTLIFWAQLLKIPQACLWFALPDEQLPAVPLLTGWHRSVNVDESLRTGTDAAQLEGVQRSAAVLTAIGLPPDLGGLLSSADGPDVLGVEQLGLFEAAIEVLEQRDATSGGGAALDVALTLHDRVTGWLQRVTPDLSKSVQVLYCELGALIGWLAYDAGKPALAKQYVNETLVGARFTEALNADLRAMNSLCLLLSDKGRPYEALQCADQAKRVATGRTTARTQALLHVRSARTYAKLGDAKAFRLEFGLAEAHLHQAEEAGSNDPPWVRFLDDAELAAVVGGSYLLLGQPGPAAEAYRTAVEASAPTDFRNGVSRTLWLAEALLRQGDVSLASTTALATITDARGLASARVIRRLHRLRRTIEGYTAAVPAAADFADAYDQTFVA